MNSSRLPRFAGSPVGPVPRSVAGIALLVGLAGALGSCAVMPTNFFAQNPRVLFDGTDADEWEHLDGRDAEWEVTEERSLMVRPGTGNVLSKRKFGDHRVLIDFRVPEMPEAQGQGRGNSGIYLHGRYEVQVLDSYGQPPALDRCAAIYGIKAPDKSVCKPPGEWQSYEITFRAPRFDEWGNVIENPRMSVVHNGTLVHEDVELPRTTAASMSSRIVQEGPLLLQDHGARVEYRNVRIETLD